MDLVQFFNDPLFSDRSSEFDRLFDYAFARRAGSVPTSRMQTESAPRAHGPPNVHEGNLVKNSDRPDVSTARRNNVPAHAPSQNAGGDGAWISSARATYVAWTGRRQA
ncbi:hypothetical protein C2E23DRAFT_590868 [Lenzites betulinus]|nr:hypothetical protein C2E23DRAFT_590868 [Lenzites betulinus]